MARHCPSLFLDGPNVTCTNLLILHLKIKVLFNELLLTAVNRTLAYINLYYIVFSFSLVILQRSPPYDPTYLCMYIYVRVFHSFLIRIHFSPFHVAFQKGHTLSLV